MTEAIDELDELRTCSTHSAGAAPGDVPADATLAPPSSGVSVMNTFYKCTQLVGGHGAVYSSSVMGYARMMEIDHPAG